MRQKSSTPKTRRDNRLSYIDNEIKVSESCTQEKQLNHLQVLDAEQLEVDKQLSILERRLNILFFINFFQNVFSIFKVERDV